MELEARSQEGVQAHQQGRFEEAEAIHLETTQAAPSNPYFQYRLAETYLARNRPQDALQHLAASVEHDPNFSLFWDTYARTLFGVLPSADALACYQSARAKTVGNSKIGVDELVATLLLQKGMVKECWESLGHVFGESAKALEVAEHGFGPQCIRLDFDESGYGITFSADFTWQLTFLIERLLVMRPAFEAVRAKGYAILSLGDAASGGQPQLCFSSNQKQHLAVPDPIFMGSNAYENFRQTPEPHWNARKPIAYWRGSLTGMATTIDEVVKLPRVKLCVEAMYRETMDAKITHADQYAGMDPKPEDVFRGMGIWGEFRPIEENLDYRYMLDVDGNTNAWQSLYVKLLCAGTIIKLKSDYHQWYYDRVKHKETVFLVDSVKEIPAAIEWCEAHPSDAQRIADTARELGLSMTVETEVEVFAEAVQRFIFEYN